MVNDLVDDQILKNLASIFLSQDIQMTVPVELDRRVSLARSEISSVEPQEVIRENFGIIFWQAYGFFCCFFEGAFEGGFEKRRVGGEQLLGNVKGFLFGANEDGNNLVSQAPKEISQLSADCLKISVAYLYVGGSAVLDEVAMMLPRV